MQPDKKLSLEIEQCFSDSFQIWTRNFLVLSLASLVVVVISAASFTILLGSMYCGFLSILLAASRGEKPRLKGVFSHLRKVIPLFIAVWFQIILTFAGLILLIVPGVFFGTSCFYLQILAADRKITFDEAFVESRKTVRRYGFRKHFFLGLVALGIPTISMLMIRRIDFVSFEALALLIPILIQPFALGLLVSAYQQTLVAEEDGRKRYMEEYEYMRDELETAHDMQMSLLPKESPKMTGYTIAGSCEPANHVGGDYFAYHWLDGERSRLAVVLADVSGKAMVAAVTAVRFNEMLRYELRGRLEPSSVLAGLQESLAGQIEPDSFITCCAAVLEMGAGMVEIANAGHCYPYHYSHRNRGVTPIELNGFALALPASLIADEPYDSVRIGLEPGDTLVLITDGILDAENVNGEFYDEARLESLIAESAAGDSADELVRRIMRSVEAFSQGAAQTDDFSVVVLKRAKV
ncbi:PP2C family protein-serine/threonine phosphatase [candidate division KSB1 bacterium]